MRCVAERAAMLSGLMAVCWVVVGCEPSLAPTLPTAPNKTVPTSSAPVNSASSSGPASVSDKPVETPVAAVKTLPKPPEAVVAPASAQKPAEAPAKPVDPKTAGSASKPPAPPAGKNAPPADGEVKLLVKEKTFKPEGNALRVSYDDIDLIKVLNLKKPEPNVESLLPGWLKALEGKRVRMRGFMYPPFQQEGISHFVFCRDTGACCFGPNPVVYYMIDVRLKPGTTTSYVENRPFDVEGMFRIKTAVLEGTKEVYELYHLDQAAVIRK